MSREAALFFAIAIPMGTVGTIVGWLLHWGDSGVFLAGMIPVGIVMLVFMRRERREDGRLDHSVEPASHRRA